MELRSTVGHWDVGGIVFSIVERESEFLVIHPEAPPGFEPRLRQTGPDEVMFEGGPYDGVRLTFTITDGVASSGLAGGAIPLTRTAQRPTRPAGAGLRAPHMVGDPARDAEFESLWNQISDRHNGEPVGYQLAVPIHEFVQFLTKAESVIFHGSNRTDIEEFAPVRKSVELHDHGGRGNLGAVYGTHDGLWAFFFAIIDRSRIDGSIRNGVSRFSKPDGRFVDVYNFSIHYELLVSSPYTNGAIYLLPRGEFERIPLYPGGPPSNEWACRFPVRPLARLLVTPSDFPFLDQIGGHDDTELIALGKLEREVYDKALTAARADGSIRLLTTAPASLVEEFVSKAARWFPDIERSIAHSPEGVVLEMRGPDAVLQGYAKRFEDLLESGD